MTQNFDSKNSIRNYLLGLLTDEAEIEQIEEKFFADDELYEQSQIIEDELIDDYLDGVLSKAEKNAFEGHFLNAPERRRKLEFSRKLRRHLQQNSKKAKTMTIRPTSRNWFFGQSKLLNAVQFAGLLILISGAAFLVWRFIGSQSDADKGLAELRAAYRTERPFEARLSGFDYAPFAATRGGTGKANAASPALDAAARKLFDAAQNEPGAKSFSALGSYYLTEKQFDKAIAQFEAALKLEPNNAQLYNNYGAALLEIAKAVAADDKTGRRTENLARALEKLDKAVALDNSLLEALFNRALCLERLNLPEQTKQAWRDYLAKDNSSPWSDEAKKHLELLAAKSAGSLSADGLENAFLSAYRAGDDDEAFRLVSQNRELISEKYLPQRLAMSYLAADARAGPEKLQLLKYLGKLEKERNKDFLAADLAAFYSKLTPARTETLKQAQTAVKNAYRLCLEKDDFTQAAIEFKRAADLFLQAGDRIEAETFCRHFIAYCLLVGGRHREVVGLFGQIDRFCEQNKYKWFGLLNGYWLIGTQYSQGEKSLLEAKSFHEKGLFEAEAMGDFSLIQRFLGWLAGRAHFVRQEAKTFGYLQRLLEFTNEPKVGVRQKFRNLNLAVEVLATRDFNGFSEVVAVENVALGEAANDRGLLITAEIDAGIVHTQAGDFNEAEKWLRKAEQTAANFIEPAQRDSQSADIFLRLGHLAKARNDFAAATRFYEKSFKLLEKTNTPALLYEAQKSMLLAYQALGDDAEVEQRLDSTLELAEKYRTAIQDEAERNSFFDNEQNVYDVAVTHKIRRGETESAFDYAEISNSRSLLDLMRHGGRAVVDAQKASVILGETVKPLKIAEIRAKMPSGVQLLQHTILPDKVLLWIISKERLTLVTSEVDAAKLKQTTENYLSLLLSKDAGSQTEAENLSRELYRVLLAPALPHLDKNKEICLIPNKFLFNLPFAALRSPDDRYFLEDFIFFYAPSANAFIFSTDRAYVQAAITDETLLSVGNPSFDRDKFPDLPDLPDAKREAEEIAHNYPTAKVLTDRNATKSAFRASSQNAAVIHLASHYVIEPNAPLLSKLILAQNPDNAADGFLMNLDLIGEPLPQTKLVVLSACQTGVEGYYNGEGLVGLSRTFLALGVPLVVASQWSVDSAATEQLMETFHRSRRAGKLSTSRAVRQAQLEMLNSSKFRSPYFWAAFAVFGGYAEF